MTRSQFGPAAGASGGAPPRLAAVKMPKFIRLSQRELTALFHVLRDPLVAHIFTLLCLHSVFDTGEFLGGYARLMDLCTPPLAQNGRRRAGPTMWQVRRAIDDLESVGLANRFLESNEAQGQLRIQITPRDPNAAPVKVDRRVSRRVKVEPPQRRKRAA